MQADFEKFLNKFPFRLRSLRKLRSLSQKELGELCDAAFNTVSNWENGLTEPNRSRWPFLVKALRVSEKLLKNAVPENEEDFEVLSQLGFREIAETQFPFRRFGGVKEEEQTYYGGEPSEEDCLRYFRNFLSRAKNAPGGLGWTYNELKQHFPLDKWEEE